jgi:hypothetical protein
LRRKSKRYLFGEFKGRGTRCKVGGPVGGLDRLSIWISKLAWGREWSENPWAWCVSRAYGFDLRQAYADWALVFGSPAPRAAGCVPVKAGEGAEKSCRSRRRRKRGLRKGKRRSRVRHTRRTAPLRQPLSKTPRDRKLDHYRRSEKWLISASEALRIDAKKFIKSSKHPSARVFRQKLKLHCLAKWQRFSEHARKCGFPPFASFDVSFFRWVDKEFPRQVGPVHLGLLTQLRNPFVYLDPPLQSAVPGDYSVETELFLTREGTFRNRPGDSGPTGARPKNLFCRQCGEKHDRSLSCPRPLLQGRKPPGENPKKPRPHSKKGGRP